VTAAPAIDVGGLCKTYRTASGVTEALRDVSLAVPRGSFVAAVGPSGCDKSTMLKIIAGIVPRSRGEIRIDGAAAAGPSEKLGVVFQSPVLLPWRSVLENILLPVQVRGGSLRAARGRALDLIALVGLSGFENRYPGELSGGMQQRVAICRALISEPDILLMDEPFGALDALTRETMNAELQRIWMNQRKTILLITHSILEAVFLSDRVLVMSGRPGTMDAVVEIDLPRPRTLGMMTDPRFGRHADEIRLRLGASVGFG
jgi:NitT/TauT family transport system ATP-binding protein